MGPSDPDAHVSDGEGPVRQVSVRPFAIAASCVSNNEFAEFAGATGYQTDAERHGWSYVFAGFLPAAMRKDAARPARAPWWCPVTGATWRLPEGPGSDLSNRGDHSVVNVSWNDATACCRWARLRLPTETEWEYAARGGLDGARYPWGDELTPGARHQRNIWQGQFPVRNTAADGFAGTALVDAFDANGYGLQRGRQRLGMVRRLVRPGPAGTIDAGRLLPPARSEPRARPGKSAVIAGPSSGPEGG